MENIPETIETPEVINPTEFIPLEPLKLAMLQGLYMGETLHGYEILKRAVGNIGLDENTYSPSMATAYRYIWDMCEKTLINNVVSPIENDDPRRKYFQITELGCLVTDAEMARIRSVIEVTRLQLAELGILDEHGEAII